MKTRNFVFVLAALASACANNTAVNNSSNAANVNNANVNASPAVQNLTTAEKPQTIKDQMAKRGEQDKAEPTLKIVSPADGSTINGSTVQVKLEISGDLKGYKPHKDPTTQMGNHIHVILDNQPYEAYYEIDAGPFELRNVSAGEHTLRVFPSRPWHESYKDKGAFQIVKFTVRNGGADTTKPATTNSGQPMSTKAGPVDAAKPLLTFSRPKGEYKGADAEAIMIDFWLANAKLTGDGGEHHVRYSVDGGEAKYIDKWEPIWLSGWSSGKHSVKIELVDRDGNVVDNGGYNSTTREITVTR